MLENLEWDQEGKYISSYVLHYSIVVEVVVHV